MGVYPNIRRFFGKNKFSHYQWDSEYDSINSKNHPSRDEGWYS
jgi:hypothetical protein